MARIRVAGLSAKDQIFDTLRREILAARLKVTLDEELGRDTSPTVTRLAKTKLPPIVNPPYVYVFHSAHADIHPDAIRPDVGHQNKGTEVRAKSTKVTS